MPRGLHQNTGPNDDFCSSQKLCQKPLEGLCSIKPGLGYGHFSAKSLECQGLILDLMTTMRPPQTPMLHVWNAYLHSMYIHLPQTNMAQMSVNSPYTEHLGENGGSFVGKYRMNQGCCNDESGSFKYYIIFKYL